MTVSAIKPNRANVPRYLRPQRTSFLASVLSPFSGDYTPIILVGSLTSFFLLSYLYDVDTTTFVVAVSILLTAAITIVLFRLFHVMLTTDPYEQVADDFPPEEIIISPWVLFESDGGSVAELYRHYKHRAYTANMMFQHVIGAFNTPAETEKQTIAVLSELDSNTGDSDPEDLSASETEGNVLIQRGVTKKAKAPKQDKTRSISSEAVIPLLTGRYSWRQVIKSLNKCEASYEHLNASAKVIYFFIPPSEPSSTPTPASTVLANTIQHGMPLEVVVLPPSHSVISSAKSFFYSKWSNLCLLALEHVDRVRGVHGVQTVATEGMMIDNPEKFQKFSEMQNPGVFSGITLDPYDNDIECISRDFPEVFTSLLDYAHPDSQHCVYQSPTERTVPMYGNLTAKQISSMCGDTDEEEGEKRRDYRVITSDTNTDGKTAIVTKAAPIGEKKHHTNAYDDGEEARDDDDEDDDEDDVDEIEEEEEDEEMLGNNTILRSAYTRLRETARETANEQRFLSSTPHCTLAHRLLALIWLLDAKYIGFVCSREQMIDMCLALGIEKKDVVIEEKEQKDWRVCAVLGMRMHQ